jgi:hypothetical protein
MRFCAEGCPLGHLAPDGSNSVTGPKRQSPAWVWMRSRVVMQKHGLAALRPVLLKMCVALTSTVVCLALAEAAFRFISYWEARKTSQAFHNLGRVEPPPDPTQNVSLRQMLRPSDNPRIIYELQPNLAVLSHQKLVRTNAHGFRGPDYRLPKGDTILRIVGLGDSVMFGWASVTRNITWPAFPSI